MFPVVVYSVKLQNPTFHQHKIEIASHLAKPITPEGRKVLKKRQVATDAITGTGSDPTNGGSLFSVNDHLRWTCSRQFSRDVLVNVILITTLVIVLVHYSIPER